MTHNAGGSARTSKRTISSLTMTAIFSAAAVQPAFLIDPGTGSILTSGILGGFAALSYTLHSQFYRLKAFMAGPAQKDQGEGNELR